MWAARILPDNPAQKKHPRATLSGRKDHKLPRVVPFRPTTHRGQGCAPEWPWGKLRGDAKRRCRNREGTGQATLGDTGLSRFPKSARARAAVGFWKTFSRQNPVFTSSDLLSSRLGGCGSSSLPMATAPELLEGFRSSVGALSSGSKRNAALSRMIQRNSMAGIRG